MNRIYAVDVETTGLDPATSSIVAIGAVNIGDPADTFYQECSVWEGAEIHDTALKINGFTREQVTTNPISEAKAIERFFAWLQDTPIMLAHNAGFDRSFVEHAARRADLKNPFSFRTIDVHSIVYMHMLRKRHKIPAKLSLNECLEYFGYAKEPDPHNALTGAKCNQMIYRSVLAGR